jgi:hypothetical protein
MFCYQCKRKSAARDCESVPTCFQAPRKHPDFRLDLGNLWRRVVLPNEIDPWSLTSLQQRLVKTGGRLVKHASYYWLLLAESHLTRRLSWAMVRRIELLPLPAA